MQTLATGVGDLKRVLTNVKIRGTWGEIQLESLLEQVLGPEQYSKNVAPKPGSSDRVEFCINLPGRSEDGTETVWLPIDAKFPQEDYQRLVAGQEAGDLAAVASAQKQLETRIKACAKDIHDKYISPPHTTDFAILFLPTEGLYAEIVRHPELTEILQRQFRIVVAGPTTLGALLNSLQMGFRTLAIEKRSSEVWKTLATIKSEFGKFGGIIDKVQKKLQAASNEMDRAASKTRTIERKLRKVEALPTSETTDFLEGAGLELDSDDDNPPETEIEKTDGADEMPRDADRA
jgi:DNA recombination protein RmuC